jgi:hypothetical protein
MKYIKTFEQFINEHATGAATYGVTTEPSSRGSIGPEYMDLMYSLKRNAINIQDQKVWDAILKSVESCRDEIVSKLKSDGNKVWQDNLRLAKEFIHCYGEDYVADFLISRMQSR